MKANPQITLLVYVIIFMLASGCKDSQSPTFISSMLEYPFFVLTKWPLVKQSGDAQIKSGIKGTSSNFNCSISITKLIFS